MDDFNEKVLAIIKNDKYKKREKLARILDLIVSFCEIAKKSYFILGSYALVVATPKERQISDLDLNMRSAEWHKLKKLVDNNIGKFEVYNNQNRWFYDLTAEYKKYVDAAATDFSIEVFNKRINSGYPNSQFSLKYLTEHRGLTHDSLGHQHFSLKTLLKWKKTMNREKDQKDIELLEKILKN